MKKLTIFTFFILLLAACNSPQDASTEDNEDIEQEEQTEEEETNIIENEEDQDTEVEEEELVEEEEETTSNEESSSANEDDNDAGDPHQEQIDLGFKIFEAQNDNDYDFLESVLSEGSKLDKDNNKFIFENVTYPHEQEFLTESEIGDLELRYTHENNADSIIVGFAAIDYENESSFVIDMEIIDEDGSWKMNDMDINK